MYDFNASASQGVLDSGQFRTVNYSSAFDREMAICIRDESLSADRNSPYHGLFNDIYPIHLKPHIAKSNVFTHRMTYNTRLDAYYENDVSDRMYLENWDRGAYDHRNIVYVQSFRTKRHVLFVLRDLSDTSRINHYINYYVNDQVHMLTDSAATIEWDIAPLGNDTSPKWERIKIPRERFNDNYDPKLIGTWVSLSYVLKGNTGFMLRVSEIDWKNTLIFPQALQDDETFPMDVYLELSPEPKSRHSIIGKNIVYNPQPQINMDGLFNEKYVCSVVPHGTKPMVFSHRMRYNTRTNSYYENECTDKKFLKKWDRGTLRHENITYQPELEIYNRKVYLARDPNNASLPANISWRFNYRPGSYVISSLTLKLEHSYWCESGKIEWSIRPLPARNNPRPEWKTLHFELQDGMNLRRTFKYSDQRIDATEYVKNQYGFTLKVQMSGGMSNRMWKETQLFRQDLDKTGSLDGEDEETFGMDVQVELIPDIACGPTVEETEIREIVKLEELMWNEYTIEKEKMENSAGFKSLARNDKTDFNIIFEEPRHFICFGVHRKVLVSFSEYFTILFRTGMRESQYGYMKWPHDSFMTLKRIIKYMYTGEIDDINTLDEWMELLERASYLFIQRLVQLSEESIRVYVNVRNIEEIQQRAESHGAWQLLNFCEKHEIKEEEDDDDWVVVNIEKKTKEKTRVRIRRKFHKLIRFFYELKLDKKFVRDKV
ncbi:14165_t:CDS:2 [Acaulospora morrowiae]|uniref:14165_t:CDS:1 n=1 Tax=Acaulospora morrowiae TaxID=94023 RepID=A0A9N9BVH2_9GLOM|nr:14165_t:CDS:2 [Acaulospora morrowiae]